MTTHPAELGRFFEDFAVGDVYQHPLGRTITEADNTWFTLLTMNTNQNHFNVALAVQNPVTGGRVIVNSGLSMALMLGMSVLDMSQNAVANLQIDRVRLVHPLYVGDTLYAESICTGLRQSATRPYAGIVNMHTRGINQDSDEILSWDRAVMVATRQSGIGAGYFPEAKSGPLELQGDLT
jgi:acyl dehydratase